MELGFVLSALRRRWWIIAITTVLCGTLATVFLDDATTEYQSQSVLLVLPNSRGGVVQTFGDANRYVQGQISAMNSETFHDRVAERAGGNETARSVDAAVVLSNETNTDIVIVDVFTTAPERSQAIAKAFAEEYVAGLKSDSDDSQQELLDGIALKLDDLLDQLADVNATFATNIARVLPSLIEQGVSIDKDLLDPATSTKRDLLSAEYGKTIEQQIALTSGGDVKVNSAIVQDANSASPILQSSRLKNTAALIGGFGLGCLIALLWNRFSARVSDDAMVSEILDLPIAANVPRTRALARRPVLALLDPPEPIRGGVGRIAVAAEAKGPVRRPTRIVVVGAQRNAGTSTLAMLIAHEFTTLDTQVALVDGSPRSRYLQSVVGHIDATYEDLDRVDLDSFQSEVVLVGRAAGGTRVRRSEAAEFLDLVGASSRVVVVDAGSVMASAATVELCVNADAVVLAVPTNRQNIATLQAVSRALARHDVLVVTTAPRRGSRGDAPFGPIAEDDTDPIHVSFDREDARASVG